VAVSDGNGTTLQSYVATTGGVLVSIAAAGSRTWSYPSLHQSVSALADNNGAKIGTSFWYDPNGTPLSAGSPPDNAANNFDFGWLGGLQRPVEHASTIQSQVELGDRDYDPSLGRFMQIDPIEGGVDNDYNYPTDPVNSEDPTGRMVYGSCLGADVVAVFGVDDGACFVSDGTRTGLAWWSGFGVGANAGAGVGVFYSPVASINDLRGVSYCASFSIAVYYGVGPGGSYCTWRGGWSLILGAALGSGGSWSRVTTHIWHFRGFWAGWLNSIARTLFHRGCSALKANFGNYPSYRTVAGKLGCR